MAREGTAMKVVDLARAAGVPPHVVRYYARIGLLRPMRDPANGYRVFRREDIARLQLIRGLRALGCSLEEVRAFLRAAEAGASDPRSLLARRLDETRREIERLRRRERRLAEVLAHPRALPELAHEIAGQADAA